MIWVSLNLFIFLNYVLLLCCYSCPRFFPFAPLYPAHPRLPQAIPTPWSMHLGHAYMLFVYSIPCAVLYIPMVFCNCLFVLLTPSPIPRDPLPSDNLQNLLYIYASVSFLLVYFIFQIQLLIDLHYFFNSLFDFINLSTPMQIPQIIITRVS